MDKLSPMRTRHETKEKSVTENSKMIPIWDGNMAPTEHIPRIRVHGLLAISPEARCPR